METPSPSMRGSRVLPSAVFTSRYASAVRTQAPPPNGGHENTRHPAIPAKTAISPAVRFAMLPKPISFGCDPPLMTRPCRLVHPRTLAESACSGQNY